VACFVYNSTDSSCPLRHFTVENWTLRYKKERFDSSKSGLPRQFIEDVCDKLLGCAEEDRRREHDGQAESNLRANDYYAQETLSSGTPEVSLHFEWPTNSPVRTSEQHLGAREVVQLKGKRRSSPATSAASTPSRASPTFSRMDAEEEEEIMSKLGAI
jgi:hypothetical protein